MRADAASLLVRLGRKDFRYREFSDSFADMELWPIFEAVLTDERVVGKQMTRLEAKEAEERSPRRAPVEQRFAPSAPAGNLFEGYGDAPASQSGTEKTNLRDFLQHLSAPRSDRND